MGSQRITPWPARPLALDAGQNAQPAVAEIASGLASNNALLAGHVVGGESVGDGPNLSPINPMGERGHDHSGGIFGRARFISVASLTFGRFDGEGVVSTQLGAQPPSVAFTTGSEPGGTTDKIRLSAPIPIWIPPCDSRLGAYLDVAVIGTVWNEVTTLTGSDSGTIEVITDFGDGGNRTVEFLWPAPSIPGVYTFQSGNLLRVRPGKFNPLNIVYTVTRGAGGVARGISGGVLELELGVFES